MVMSLRTPANASIAAMVQDAGVALIVRDADVSDEDALACAFETAHELTGVRAGLHTSPLVREIEDLATA